MLTQEQESLYDDMVKNLKVTCQACSHNKWFIQRKALVEATRFSEAAKEMGLVFKQVESDEPKDIDDCVYRNPEVYCATFNLLKRVRGLQC